MFEYLKRLSVVIGLLSTLYAIATFIYPGIPYWVRSYFGPTLYAHVSANCYEDGGFADRGTFDLGPNVDRETMLALRNIWIDIDLETPLRSGEEATPGFVEQAEKGDLFKIIKIVEVGCTGAEAGKVKLLALGKLLT